MEKNKHPLTHVIEYRALPQRCAVSNTCTLFGKLSCKEHFIVTIISNPPYNNYSGAYDCVFIYSFIFSAKETVQVDNK